MIRTLLSDATWIPLAGLMLGASSPPPADIFTGTFALERGEIILWRCDLGETRYALVANGSQLAQVRAKLEHASGPLQGDVIGVYAERGGHPALEVQAVDNLQPGDCHLSHATDGIEQTESPTRKPEAQIEAALPAVIGHYYLAGVRETGSELLLRGDGTFEWYISYGAVDRTARGNWTREGIYVVLTATMPDTTKPLYAFREIQPWSTEAEDALLEKLYEGEVARVEQRCPFLRANTLITPPPAMPAFAPKPPSDESRAKAAAALGRALAARSRFERLAHLEVQAGKAGRAPTEAGEALDEWIEARYEAFVTAEAAGLPRPELRDPVLPQACTLPDRREAASLPPDKWHGGTAVRVTDASSKEAAHGIAVVLRLANGSELRGITQHSGVAVFPGKLPAPTTKLSLSTRYAPGRDQSLDLPPTTSGVIAVTIDGEQLIPPPFTTLRLRIEGDGLVAEEFGGRYTRH